MLPLATMNFASLLLSVVIAVAILALIAKVAATKAINEGKESVRFQDKEYDAFEVRDRASKWFLISAICTVFLFLFTGGSDR